MEHWIYCDDSATYNAEQHHGQAVTLSRHAKSTSLLGAYSHVFSASGLVLVDMEKGMEVGDVFRLSPFAKQYLTTDFVSEMAGEVSYRDIYFAALRQSNSASLTQDFFSALGVDGGVVCSSGVEQLIIPDLRALQYISSCARHLPKNVWFHGSREKDPITQFSHGHYPAQAGFAGFGTVEVSRHAFFFSSDPRMSESFGSVHAYEVDAHKILDITADLSEEDSEKIRAAGFSPESIDRMYEKWELFDGENGKVFCDALLSIGYDAVRYSEVDQNGVMRECMAALTPSIVRHVTPEQSLIRDRVKSLELFDAWRTMYAENRKVLSSEQLERCLAAIGSKAGLPMVPGFYERVERALKIYDYSTVLQHVSALVVKDVDMNSPNTVHTPELKNNGRVIAP